MIVLKYNLLFSYNKYFSFHFKKFNRINLDTCGNDFDLDVIHKRKFLTIDEFENNYIGSVEDLPFDVLSNCLNTKQKIFVLFPLIDYKQRFLSLFCRPVNDNNFYNFTNINEFIDYRFKQHLSEHYSVLPDLFYDFEDMFEYKNFEHLLKLYSENKINLVCFKNTNEEIQNTLELFNIQKNCHDKKIQKIYNKKNLELYKNYIQKFSYLDELQKDLLNQYNKVKNVNSKI